MALTAEALTLATSLMQGFLALRRGQPMKLPPPLPGYDKRLLPEERALLDSILACSFFGSPATVESGMRELMKKTRADEIMVAAQIFDHEARKRSFTLAAEVRDRLGSDQSKSVASPGAS